MVNSKLTILQYANTIEDKTTRDVYLNGVLSDITSASDATSKLEESIVSATTVAVGSLTVGNIFKYSNILWILLSHATGTGVVDGVNVVMSLDAVGPMSIFSQRDVNYKNSIIKHNINMLDGNTGKYVYSGVPADDISTEGGAIITHGSFTDNFSTFNNDDDTSAFCIPDLSVYQIKSKLLDPIYTTTVRTWTASARSTIAGETELVIRDSNNKFDFAKYNEKHGVRLITKLKDNVYVKKLNIVTPSWT